MPLTLLHRNLLTFGSPHQGVFGIPECEAEVRICFLIFCSRINVEHQVGNALLCELARQLISLGAYEPWIQVCDSETLSRTH